MMKNIELEALKSSKAPTICLMTKWAVGLIVMMVMVLGDFAYGADKDPLTDGTPSHGKIQKIENDAPRDSFFTKPISYSFLPDVRTGHIAGGILMGGGAAAFFKGQRVHRVPGLLGFLSGAGMFYATPGLSVLKNGMTAGMAFAAGTLYVIFDVFTSRFSHKKDDK
jgi:hypothetical protein